MWDRVIRVRRFVESNLLSPVPWLALALIAAIAAQQLPGHRRAIGLAFLGVIAFLLAWLILYLERVKRTRPRWSLAHVDRLDGFAFEQWVIDMLQSGGHRCRNIRDRGDFGVDLIALVQGTPVGVQTKRYQGNVGNAAVQQVLAGCDYYRCHVAVVVTQSYFTPAALAQAAHARYPIVLVDRDQLGRLVHLIRREVDRSRGLAAVD